ncbi:MAG: DUF484 family protein [Burkholderiaceae bacterium]|nr:DUF484 family protein [Burkholderiaceae bacterium]
MNEDDVTGYIQNNPQFFRDKPWLLASIDLPDPHDGRVISLAERQTQILRDRVRALEANLAELAHNGRDNDALAESLTLWCAALLAERDEARLPQRIVDGLKDLFSVPAVALRIWEFQPRFAGLEWMAPVGADVVRFAASMQAPFCGMNADFEAAGWMRSDLDQVRSLALIPLRAEAAQAPLGPPFGLLTLGSADPHRFRGDMGTAFLGRIGRLAGAVLSRLRG